jgi:hypothetical protein
LGLVDYGAVSHDQDIDPEQWHAAFFASVAEAGGAVWEKGVGSAVRRREFWTWYLGCVVSEVGKMSD